MGDTSGIAQSSSNTPSRPITDTMVSMADHERSVSRTERLKYSLNSQKPLSLKC